MRDVVKRTKLTENCSKKTIKKYVDEVIQELTLDEKIGVMSGQVTEKKLLDDLFLIEHYNVKPYPTKAVERLGIPNIRFVDGPRGVVAGSATCFPVSMARGASFDRDLEEKIGEVIGAEVRAVGGNYYGGVCINLPRNPRWGRAQECYGEDTYHLGEMGAALTRGVQSQNVMACIKHFAMNSIENARFKADVHADKRTLFEVYLPHFKRCIEEGAASVMGAYNKVYGEQASESKYLLKDILRDKWGFEGFTLSDFLWAVKDGPKAVKSGMNVEMPCICHYAEQIPKAIEDGTLAMEDVDEAVGYILRTVLYYETRKDPQEYTEDILACPEHIAVAKRAAEESMVLLKNENHVLPLDKEKTEKIVVLGVLGDTENIGDHGSSKVHPYYTVTPFKGLMKKMPKAQILYNDGSDLERAKELAADADAVVIVAGYIHSDEGEYLADRSDIAGMGGELMIRILDEGRHVWESVDTWVLSPQSELEEVRRFLLREGFAVLREQMVKDNGKFYTVMAASRGKMECEQKEELRYGPCLIRDKNPVLLEYLAQEEKRILGIREGFDLEKAEQWTPGQRTAFRQLGEELELIGKTRRRMGHKEEYISEVQRDN